MTWNYILQDICGSSDTDSGSGLLSDRSKYRIVCAQKNVPTKARHKAGQKLELSLVYTSMPRFSVILYVSSILHIMSIYIDFNFRNLSYT